MNFLQLTDFLTVVEQESISKAAEVLCVTQQTLSGHMAALEAELGCQLFERRPKFRLTYGGERLYRYANQLLDTRRAMEQEFSDIRGETRGMLRIGAGNIRSRAWMPPLISAYHKKFPEMELQIIEGSNEALLQQLLSGALDLILVYIPKPLPEICAQTLYQEQMLLIAPRGYLTDAQQQAVRSGDLRALADCRFLMNPPDDNAGRIGRQLLRQAGILPHVDVTAFHTDILLSLCLRGEGVCFCPDFMAKAVLTPEEQNNLLFFPVSEPYPVSLAWQRGQYVSRHILEFRDVAVSLREEIVR